MRAKVYEEQVDDDFDDVAEEDGLRVESLRDAGGGYDDEEVDDVIDGLDDVRETDNIDDEKPHKVVELKPGLKLVRRLGYVPINMVIPNPMQPRDKLFEDETEKQEMVESIREKGILRPAIVIPFGNGFKLKDGERRWTCALLAKLTKFYCIAEYYVDNNGKKSVADNLELLEDAAIANLHQKKMSPIEEAKTYVKWLQMTGKNQTALAKRFGKSLPEVGNLLRLLRLRSETQLELSSGKISRVLAQNIVSYPAEQHEALRHEYEKELKRYGGGIPSSNPNAWVARTLRRISEHMGITPLKSKNGKIKPYFDMLVKSADRCVIQMDNILTELKSVSNPTLSMNKVKALEVLSRIDRLMERVEQVAKETRERLS
jgi:ParB/RepB/Spo0J family partition protein